ncbi:MAG: gamma-glutamyltransferase [Calditrichaeota bacterium]|nr:MAG: gamma-glutamyltransferase [Calditrichota bacterium]MBL1204337.1 gamma-glutamyltransferase [Calditrichota bacterium]NOG44166.1 gamma-glutamyltransferase [Calditrichota bacterium]
MSIKTIFFLIIYSVTTLFANNGRTPAYAKNGMVVSTSIIASEVGRDILKKGGNAIDAVVATAFALAVTIPQAGNIGGGGFLVLHKTNGDVTTFDFREKAPLAATKEMYLNKDGKVLNNSNHDSLIAVGVPGTVAGLYKAHKKYGKLDWADLVEPAIKLAEEGFPFTWYLYNDVTRDYSEKLAKFASTKRKFINNKGELYQPGELWPQPDLAKTLKRIQQHGHDGFYKGETAKLLAKFMRENGGIITEEDLAKYQAVERKPVRGNYRGFDVWSMPPPASGGVAILEMLNILEGYNLKGMGHNSALYLHLLTEAMRRAFADRAQYLGDPDFNKNMPVQKLISKEHAKTLRSGIDFFKASESDSSKFNQTFDKHNTTHFSVVDSEGNAVSLTYTIEQWWGSKIVAEGLGFFLNNEMGDFNAIPGLTNRKGRIGTKANIIEPEKRMLSSMSPTIVAKDGKPVLVIGSPGGRTIINTTLQVILNVIDHEMNIGQAIEAGRIHHQWLPDKTYYEEWQLSPDTKRLYESMGHILYEKGVTLGRAMGIYVDYESGIISGAADTRSPDGGAAGY